MAFAKKFVKTSVLVGGALAALAIYNRVTESMAGELDTVLTGEERRYAWKYGDMFYEVKGPREAKPLVLLHSLGPGTSSYEWRRNLDTLAENFRVYALDLLGIGLSDRPAIDYDGELYADLLGDFLKETVEKPAIVVAHGLSSAFAVAAAYRRPKLFEHLVLVTPPANLLQEKASGPLNRLWRLTLQTPIIGEFVYNLLTTRGAIRRYYDRQGYHNPGLITDELIEYLYTSAHQPGSRFAASSLLSQQLHLNIEEPLSRLQVPITAIWGREGELLPSEASTTFRRINPGINVHILDKASHHVQDEQAPQFNRLLQNIAGVHA